MGFCNEPLGKVPITDYIPQLDFLKGEIGIVGFLLALMYLASFGTVMYWIHHQTKLAKHGSKRAARLVIFPCYLRIMYMAALSDFMLALLLLNVELELNKNNNFEKSITYGIMIGFQHTIWEMVPLLFMMYGCGDVAFKRAFKYSLLWGILTAIMLTFGYHRSAETIGAFLQILWAILQFVFYGVVWLAPQKWLYRRWGILPFARFWFLLRIGMMICASLQFASDDTRPVGNCAYVFGPLFVLTIFKQPLLYVTLLRDSEWWQGKNLETASRGVKGFTSYTQNSLLSPLMGIDLNPNSAQSLANSMDTLQKQSGVKLLNFAYMSLDRSKMLGMGSSSKVYMGLMKNKRPVAIKLLFTMDLTHEIIHRVCMEVSILTKLKHPNVVNIYGISILPPSICIVLEFCKLGSLGDVIHLDMQQIAGMKDVSLINRFQTFMRMSVDNTPISADSNHIQFQEDHSNYLQREFDVRESVTGRLSEGRSSLSYNPYYMRLSWEDMLWLALGSARGLAAVHQMSPDMCHRDIKSFNFLVTENLDVKIADLELGDEDEDGFSDISFSEEMLPNWSPPEVLSATSSFTQAGDIYALGLVFWEIVAREPPFDKIQSRSEIVQEVVMGRRPHIPTSTPPEYKELISRCWDQDPTNRLTADEVVEMLESMLSSCFNKYIPLASSPPLQSFPSDTSYLDDQDFRDLIRPLEPVSEWAELEKSGRPFVVTSACKPYRVVYVTKAWSDLIGYGYNHIMGKELNFLHGELTNKASLDHMSGQLEEGNRGHCVVVNYRADGQAFFNSLHISPLFSIDQPDSPKFYISLSNNLIDFPPHFCLELNGEESLEGWVGKLFINPLDRNASNSSSRSTTSNSTVSRLTTDASYIKDESCFGCFYDCVHGGFEEIPYDEDEEESLETILEADEGDEEKEFSDFEHKV